MLNYYLLLLYPEALSKSRSHSPFLCVDKMKGNRNSPSLAFQVEKLRELQGFSKPLCISFPWPQNWLVQWCLGKADFICTLAPKDLPLKVCVSLPNLHRQAVSAARDPKADGVRWIEKSAAQPQLTLCGWMKHGMKGSSQLQCLGSEPRDCSLPACWRTNAVPRQISAYVPCSSARRASCRTLHGCATSS